MKAKIGWLVRSIDYDDDNEKSYGRWEFVTEEPSKWGEESKKIVYFEVEDGNSEE